MASASLTTEQTEDGTSGRSFLGSFAKTETPSHTSTASANVYTPLLAPARLSKGHTSSLDSTTKGTNISSKDDASKTIPVVITKQVNRPTLQLQSQNPRGQRSSVRPFFCCGSELSLVSLVDGLDVKDSCTKEKRASGVSGSGSSDEEESIANSGLSRKGSSSHATGSFYSGESRHTVVRRKLQDKHSAKKKSWSLRFRRRWNTRWRVSQAQHSTSHRFDLSRHAASGTYQRSGSPGVSQRSPRLKSVPSSSHFIDLSHVQDFDRLYPVNDVDTINMRERAEEMRTGVEVDSVSLTRSNQLPQPLSNSVFDILRPRSQLGSVSSDPALPSPDTPTQDYSVLVNSVLWQWQGSRSSSSVDGGIMGSPRVHTQVDFIHCLVPDLVRILSCPFYWGVMDRYEAERLLDNKPEGTFLLRDSAQEDFLFSVSFRRYNRSLHARVEQWNHRFSFDAHDPAVFSAPTVCELMEHYKDPCCCMFFEPMLTRPLPRNFPFSLQHICRAVICDRIVYDQIRFLPLPNSLKQFLQAYHYKQKVRVRRFDGPDMAYSDTNVAS